MKRLLVLALALAPAAASLTPAAVFAQSAPGTPPAPATTARAPATTAAPPPAAPGASPASSAAGKPALPQGHPPVGGGAKTASEPLPQGHPPVGDAKAGDEPLPEGHPSVAAPDTRSDPIPDRVVGAPDLAPGSIEVVLRDERDAPVAGATVELAILHHDVAQGDSTERRQATSDADGRALFRDNPHSTSITYRASIRRGKATFTSPEFQLAGAASAQRVLLHSYPSTSDIRNVLVGLRGLVAIQPREDVFHVEATFDVFNIGRSAWVPENLTLPVPAGAKAIRAKEEGAARLVAENGKLRFAGTFGPGQHQIGYSFQIANERESARTFRLPLPPHVAELRVVTEAPRGLSLDVSGFPEAQRMRSQTGSWLLVTGKQMVRGDQELSSIEVNLRGLPVPSTGRWYAVAAAVAVAAAGLWSAANGSGKKGGSAASIAKDDAEQARSLILDELVLLEKLRARGEIGPRTYQSNRDALLDALGRLEVAARKPAPSSAKPA